MALVHDWLTGYRGGERVLSHLAHRYPNADLFTLIHKPGSVPSAIENRTVHTSPLNQVPGIGRHYRKLLPLFPWAIQRFDFTGYDLVLSTSHAVAKSVPIPAGVPHVSYCFTPMRYIWDQQDSYLGQGPRRWIAKPLVRRLQAFDRSHSGPDSVTRFLAISRDVSDRIRRHYGRDSAVVPPPVDLSWIDVRTQAPDDFYLLVSGFVPYKRDDLAIEAFRQNRKRLIVVGDGPARAKIEANAPANIEFRGRVSDQELAELYRRTRALLYPQHEDFGLTAVEAQAAGAPIIAYRAGGAVDTVRGLDEPIDAPRLASLEGPDEVSATRTHAARAAHSAISSATPDRATGVFFDEQTPASITRAVEAFEKAEIQFSPEAIRAHAESFSPARFDAALTREIEAARGTLA